MGISLDRLQVVKGGTPGDLDQSDKRVPYERGKTPIVSIRNSTYRGRQGFLVVWKRGVMPQSVWTETREVATAIKQAVRDGAGFDEVNRILISGRDDRLLFQGPKASVEFTGVGEAIIRALENPNVSSGVHEAAHVARRFLFDRSLPQEIREGITDEDILTAEAWAGAEDVVWTRDAEEKFARGFERYMADGEAPTESLRGLFEQFARWVMKVYKSISGSAIDVDISPAMRQVFDRLVTRSERLQQAEEAGDASFDVDALESDLDTLYQDGPYKADNPFAAKAIAARRVADRLNSSSSAHDRGMAQSFPLGAGFGRNGGEKRIEASINRAVKAVEAEKLARHLEAQASAFDEGKITAQGRRRSPAFDARSDKAAVASDNRKARIAAAVAERGEQERWQVRGAVWADAAGYLGGSGRELVLADHREAVEKALAQGRQVPADVLADYPDLAPDVLDTG